MLRKSIMCASVVRDVLGGAALGEHAFEAFVVGRGGGGMQECKSCAGRFRRRAALGEFTCVRRS